jgi:hypothetical protein
MSMNTANTNIVIICVGLFSFGGMIFFLGVSLRLAYTKMDLMLGHLKNCPAVMNRVFFLNSGPKGRLFVLGGIIGLMITPRIYLRDGGASAEDLDNFPADLRRKLIILHWAGWVPILTLFGMIAVVKLELV